MKGKKMNKVSKLEYIWVDGAEPTATLRSKTKIVPTEKADNPPEWGFDGSSTNQAGGEDSDRVLRPVFMCDDPIRGLPHKLVMCEVHYPDGTPHESNTRNPCSKSADKYAKHEPWFGIEQEYTFMQQNGRPLGFPENGFPEAQGKYYCGVGADRVFGRDIVEEHLELCLEAGLCISGINAEVMPGQWEFQVGPAGALEVSDHLWIARYLLDKVAEKHDVSVSYASKPMKGDWNGTGAHCNFSTKEIREDIKYGYDAIEALRHNHMEHINSYGVGYEERLTGDHETCAWNEFRAGVSDRGASVRIPWQVARDGKGYIEDRRPQANCDPYIVTHLLTKTVGEYFVEYEGETRPDYDTYKATQKEKRKWN